MSTEHHTHDDQRLEPNATGEQVEDPGIDDQRWHDVLANFVDDPRGAVLAATELVVNDVSAFVAVLDQRRKSMLNAPPEDHAANTEDLLQAAATYRDISKQLTARGAIQPKSTRHFEVEVWEARQVKANQGAAGVDGQSIADFEADLKNNLFKVWNRMSLGTYFPPAVRAEEIPKQHGGGTRMLGIPVHLIASGDAVQVQ